MSKNNTIARIKQRKELKAKIVRVWYFLMKPLAISIDKLEVFKNKILQFRASKITNERAVDIYIKILINNLLKYNCNETFVIADWVNYEYDDSATIIKKMKKQRRSKVLKEWTWKQDNGKQINKELTNILVEKLKEYSEIECEYYHSGSDKWYSNGYETSLRVSLKDK